MDSNNQPPFKILKISNFEQLNQTFLNIENGIMDQESNQDECKCILCTRDTPNILKSEMAELKDYLIVIFYVLIQLTNKNNGVNNENELNFINIKEIYNFISSHIVKLNINKSMVKNRDSISSCLNFNKQLFQSGKDFNEFILKGYWKLQSGITIDPWLIDPPKQQFQLQHSNNRQYEKCGIISKRGRPCQLIKKNCQYHS